MLSRLEFICNSSNNALNFFSILFKSTSIGFALGIGVTVGFVLEDEYGIQITDNSRKGVGFVSYNAVPPPPIGLFSPPNLDLSNSGLEEFQQPEFEGYGPKTSKSISEDISNEVRKSPDASLVEKLVSNEKLKKKTVFPAKIEFVRPKQQEKPVKLTAITIKGKGWNIVPRAVLMKTGLRPFNTARLVNTAHPKTTFYSARPMSCFYKSAQPKAVNTARPNSAVVNAIRANQVNVVKALACWIWRPTKLNSASITFKRHNYVDAQGRSKSVMAWVPKGNSSPYFYVQSHPQKEDQGYVDSGCSRHITSNMSYLSDFKEFDEGYVTFRGGAK
ncbi:hypothetical protein Tco_1444414 [Tanacetum coccineum]